jgi:hypothetical protein
MRCDLQERFPDPCSRCANTRSAVPKDCHVDPQFKRRWKNGVEEYVCASIIYTSDTEPRRSSATSAVPPPTSWGYLEFNTSTAHESLEPGPLLTNGPTVAEDASQAISFMRAHVQDVHARTLDAIHLSSAEVITCFDE